MPLPRGEPCPPESALHALLAGSLPAEEWSALREHVVHCVACSHHLSRRTLDKTLSPPANFAATLLRPDSAKEEMEGGISITDEAEGRYQVFEEIGRGGQSIVFRAMDTHLGREVAFKVPRAGSDGHVAPAALGQFLREARITARLEHPNIVPIHEIGRRRDGTWYCTTRLIRRRGGGESNSLAVALRKAKTLEDRLSLLPRFVDVCSAVAHAHMNRIIHRDLKPENIVIGELGETIVLDWGIARSSEPSAIDAAVVGTPLYMAPEQARGDVGLVNERSDVWSLGVMLYELLTGSLPFMGSSVNELLTRVKEGVAAPVRVRERHAPRALAAVAERCLSKNPATRYPNAAELGADLEAFLAHKRVRAYSYRAGELLRLFVERNKAVSLIGVISLALIAAAGVATVQSYLRSRRYLSEALVEKARGSEAALRWDEAAAYYAAARVEQDTPAARYGSMLAASRADLHLPRLRGHKGVVKAIAASADGKLLLSGGNDGTLRLWDVATGAQLWVVDPNSKGITAVAFSPEGEFVLAADESRRVRRFAITGGNASVVYEAAALVNSLRLSRNGQLLAMGLEDSTVALLSLDDFSVRVLSGHTNPVYAATLSHDDRLLASASWDRSICIWDVASGALLRTLRGHDDSVLTVEFAQDDKVLFSGSRDASLRLWEVATGALIERLAGHTQKVTALALSPDESRFASASNDRSVRMWSLQRTPRPLIGQSLGVDEGLTSVVFLGPDTLAFAGEDGALYLRTVRAPQWSPPVDQPSPSSEDLALAQGLLISNESFKGGVRALTLRDLRTLEILSQTPEFVDEEKPTVPGSATSVTADARFVFGASVLPARFCTSQSCREFKLALQDLSSGATVFETRTDLFPLSSAISPDGSRIVLGTKQGPVLVLDARSGAELRKLTDASTGVFGLAFSPDGKQLAAASYDRALRLYDTRTWTHQTLGFHEHGIRTVRFSPDGALLATGGYDRIIRLWDVRQGKEIAALKGHDETVWSVAFSPDGKLLASGAWDGTVRLWDVQQHTELARYVSNDVRVHSVLFAADTSALFYSGVRPYRVDFPELSSPAASLRQTLELTGFELRGTALVRKR